MTDHASVAAVRARYGAAIDGLLVSQVADSCDKVGLRSQVMGAEVVPVAAGRRAFGPASTLQFAPMDGDPGPDPYQDFIDYLDGVPRGGLAVIATSCPDRSALWGELFSAAAQSSGIVGMVTDGYTRDAARIVQTGFAAFSRGHLPVDYRARQRVVGSGAEVRCAGVVVSPGDWVLADDDGVVAIPRHRLFDVLDEATARLRGENTVLRELQHGARLGEVWARHRLL